MTNKHQQTRKKTSSVSSMRIIIPEKRMGVIQSIINVETVECALANSFFFTYCFNLAFGNFSFR
jgi:hypothetical protein